MYFHKTALCITAIFQSLKIYLYFWSEKQCFKVKGRETKEEPGTKLCDFK